MRAIRLICGSVELPDVNEQLNCFPWAFISRTLFHRIINVINVHPVIFNNGVGLPVSTSPFKIQQISRFFFFLQDQKQCSMVVISLLLWTQAALRLSLPSQWTWFYVWESWGSIHFFTLKQLCYMQATWHTPHKAAAWLTMRQNTHLRGRLSSEGQTPLAFLRLTPTGWNSQDGEQWQF